MENFLSGGVAELEQAKAAIIDEANKSVALSDAEKALKSKEKDLDAQKKFMEDKIESSIKNRRTELEKSHDEQIKFSKKDLRDAKKSRTDAKTEAVNQRIGNETSELVGENGRLNARIKAELKQWKIPGFANTSYYYALFAPKSFKDILAFIITILVCVALIPNIVCYFLNVPTVIKVLVYVAIVVFFVLIYLLVMFWTRAGAKGKIIEKIRPTRNRIKENKKEIKKLSKNIKGDNDETSYGLDQFDSEIQRIEGELESKETAKEAALKDFDEQTATAIKAQIESENLPLIEQIEEELQAAKEDLAAKKSASEAASAEVNSNYVVMLGAKNATPEKIDELISIINEGKAENIMQALDVLSGEIK